MRRFTLLLLSLLFVLSFSNLVAQDTPASQSLVAPLEVVDTLPFVGEELDLQSPIQVFFDRPVDCDTAQAAVSLNPSVAGTVTCNNDDSSLTFTPSGPFKRDGAYTLTISDGLRGQDGSALAEPFTLELNTIGYLAVTDVLPRNDSAEIASDSVITVIFNRPVVELVIAEEMAALPSPITISPAVEGTGEWLNTSIYTFRPDVGYAGGTQYTVTVDPNLQALDGAVLQAPYSWSFTTAGPQIIELIPTDLSSDVGLDQTLQVRFNQPMDRASVEANFYLRPQNQSEGTVAGTFEWAEDNAGFSFDPTELLQLDTIYDAGFNTDAVMTVGGGASLQGSSRWTYATVPYPAIVSTSPSDGDTDVIMHAFEIYFASPMDIDTLEGKVTVEPAPGIEPDFYYNDYNHSYTVSFLADPITDYTITIAPGMADVYGNVIEEGRVIHFTTTAAAPDLLLNVPGGVGFYNANAEQTQLFFNQINNTRLDLNLYSVSPEQFGRGLSESSYDLPNVLTESSLTRLRTWSQVVAAAPNNWGYELLQVGSQSAAADCPDAPPSRLHVGDIAVVISDPDPVRARSAPVDGEVVAQLYKDYSLPVMGGPVCSAGIVWWEVQLRDDSRAWVAEGLGDEYFLDVRIPGNPQQVTVAQQGEDGPLAPGIYLLTVTTPETADRGYNPNRHVMVVGTANLSLKYMLDSVVVWATDVQTGNPIPNAPITLYDKNYAPVGTGTTDASGLVTIETPQVFNLYEPLLALLQDDNQFGVGFSSWTEGIEPYEFSQASNFYPEPYRGYVYTDRPLYRPDQPVYFRGIIRAKDDVTYTPPGIETIPVKIYDANGEVVYDDVLPLTPFGTFSGQFDIADDAPLGYYRVAASMPTNDPNGYQPEAGISFGVAEYRLPEFEVNVTPSTEAVVQDDKIQVEVESRYYFGGLVTNADVSYSVVSNPYFFEYEGSGSYDFFDYNYDSGPGEFYSSGAKEIASGSGTTDERGMFSVEVPATLDDATQSQSFTIEVVVSDESQQIVAGRADVVVHKGLVYIGARPENFVGTVGREETVNLIAVDWDSNPIPNQVIDIEVVERRWSSVQEQDESGRTTWTWEVEEIPVTTGSATTDENGKTSFNFTPPNGGVFKVKIKTRDADGNEVMAATTLWVSSGEYIAWRQQNSNRIDLIADQTDYSVGDTASILITSPWQGSAQALITVERGAVLKTEQIELTNNSTIYELPITGDFAPNVYVSVLLVKGVDANNPVPAFRAGLVQLGVDNYQKELTIEITPDREQVGPRDTMTYTVKTTDFEGNPVAAEVGVGLTDAASLAIAPPNSTPMLGYFYGQQGLSVRTSTPLTINVDQLTQYVLDVIKGGGGGGGEGGIFDVRQNFVDTAYWNGSVITDETGTATFEVTLPDNLTTWRLDARAVTSGADGLTLVGQNTIDILSTKPLLIRPVTPRFLVVGDEVALAAIVNNNTGADMPVEVSIQGTGLTFTGESTQTFAIPSGGRRRVEWVGTVQDVPNIDVTFFANGNDGEFTDASKPPLGQGEARVLPVYKYEVPETVGTGGLLREGGSRTESISLPRRFDVTQGELSISIDPSLAATTIDGLDYLENFPHQCIEQTVSKFLPNVMSYRALDSLGVANAELKGQLDTAVSFALQRLYATQKADGGWGWFVQDESNALTTAYALIGLSEARNSNFNVSADVILNAQTFVQSALITPGLDQETWRLNRQAFLLYALARSGAPDVARTSTLFDSRERLSLYAKGFLALTFNLINPADTSRSDTLLSDLVNSAILSATGAHWEEAEDDYYNWNTDTRTTAIVLDALIKLSPQSDLIPNVVRWLMIARKSQAWETTQETAWAVMSLTDWMVLTGELQPDYSFSASINGDLLTEGTATPENVRDSIKLQVEVADLLADQANELTIGRTEGNGVLYYTAHLRAFLPVPEIEPLNRGIIVDRRYTLPGSNDPVTEATVGELVQVHLTIVAPNDLLYAVIEDPIPAGTEGVNPNLATEQQIGTQPGLENSDPLRYGWGWWYFSNIEFRDEKVVLYSSYLPAGTYEYVYNIRAGLPGTYNVIPPTGYEFYFPEVYGRGAGSTFTVLPAEQ
jgi:alpha-2-macroglobulin